MNTQKICETEQQMLEDVVTLNQPLIGDYCLLPVLNHPRGRVALPENSPLLDQLENILLEAIKAFKKLSQSFTEASSLLEIKDLYDVCKDDLKMLDGRLSLVHPRLWSLEQFQRVSKQINGLREMLRDAKLEVEILEKGGTHIQGSADEEEWRTRIVREIAARLHPKFNRATENDLVWPNVPKSFVAKLEERLDGNEQLVKCPGLVDHPDDFLPGITDTRTWRLNSPARAILVFGNDFTYNKSFETDGTGSVTGEAPFKSGIPLSKTHGPTRKRPLVRSRILFGEPYHKERFVTGAERRSLEVTIAKKVPNDRKIPERCTLSVKFCYSVLSDEGEMS